jgi:uncharacterized protein (DUF983 family)
LFAGYLKTVERCETCGTDLAWAGTTEGPAVFIILIVGVIILGAAALVETTFQPPPFVHLLLWLPATVLLSLLLLRPFKATLVALQYQRVYGGGDRG